MSSAPLSPLDPATTALILVDLQKGVISRQGVPYSTADVVARGIQLAERFREAGALVILVRVSFSPGYRDALQVPSEVSVSPSSFPTGWDELVPEIGPREGDLVITKRQWGAFYGTDLELQLRRRGIRTLVVGGVATNIGVESTVRTAYELGFAQILVEDAMTALSAEAHEGSCKFIFPRVGYLRSTADVLQALNPASV